MNITARVMCFAEHIRLEDELKKYLEDTNVKERIFRTVNENDLKKSVKGYSSSIVTGESLTKDETVITMSVKESGIIEEITKIIEKHEGVKEVTNLVYIDCVYLKTNRFNKSIKDRDSGSLRLAIEVSFFVNKEIETFPSVNHKIRDRVANFYVNMHITHELSKPKSIESDENNKSEKKKVTRRKK